MRMKSSARRFSVVFSLELHDCSFPAVNSVRTGRDHRSCITRQEADQLGHVGGLPSFAIGMERETGDRCDLGRNRCEPQFRSVHRFTKQSSSNTKP